MEMTPAMNEKLRLQAYYYGFSETGVRSIDLVLRAVSMAGKLFHHTDQWTSEIDYPIEDVRGSSPVDWIQNAADDAAAAHAASQARCAALEQRVVELREALDDIAEPLKALKAKAKQEGGNIDGMMASRLCADANWLREKARRALAHDAQEGGEGGFANS